MTDYTFGTGEASDGEALYEAKVAKRIRRFLGLS